MLKQDQTGSSYDNTSTEKSIARECDSGNEKKCIDCKLTLLLNKRGCATKIFKLDDRGKLRKQSAASIFEGEAARLTISSLDDLLDHLEKLTSGLAFCFGVPDKKHARLLTHQALRSGANPDAIARDRDHFSFRKGQPGILMLDCDARDGQPAPEWRDIDNIIGEIITAWAETRRLWRPSSSSFIYKNDGTELIGMGGWRCYVMVDDASAVPAVGAYIYQRLWEMGHGYVLISKSGQALDRSLVDASVWQPERIDFAAEPVLANGLSRRAPQPILLGSVPLLATCGIKASRTLEKWRQSSEVLRRAKEEVRQECEEVRKVFIATRIKALKRDLPQASEESLRKVLHQAVEHRVLCSDFVLYRPDGSSITVGEILADTDKWH